MTPYTAFPDIETTAPPAELPPDLTPELARAFNALVRLAGGPKIELAAQLLEEIYQKSGYGSVKIIIADRRCEVVKQEISHK